MHIEAGLLAIKLLGKCGVFCSQLDSEIEDFHIHLLTMIYGEIAPSARKYEFWTVVLIMVKVIWREFRKVRAEAETTYGSEDQVVMVGK